MSNIEKKLAAMAITLPIAPPPAANYLPFTKCNNMLFISGQISKGEGGDYIGKIGDDLNTEQGIAAAKLCAINILAQAKQALGDLDKIKQILKIQGFVNSTPDFQQHPLVVNGASDFFVEVLGDKGKHARAAIGMASLPLGVAVEIDAIIEFA